MSMQIELNIEEYPDLELLEKGFHLRLSRIFINTIFRTERGWTEARPAIVDTGSPISVRPKDIWSVCQHKIFTQTKIYGMVPKNKAKDFGY